VSEVDCNDCGFPFNLNDVDFVGYFSDDKVNCPKCNHGNSIWDILNKALNHHFSIDGIFSFIGAKRKIFKVHMEENTLLHIKFTDYGIPEHAKILKINYTVQPGILSPIEVHGNSTRRNIPQDQVLLYPAKIHCEDDQAPNILGVFITWVEVNESFGKSYSLLVQALEKCYEDDYLSAIVAANTAIELEVMKFTDEIVSSVTSNKNKKEFFSNSTYIPTLKTLLPLITTLRGDLNMPSNVQLALINLATHRNNIAHTGDTKTPVDSQEIARLLSGVVLGLRYLKMLGMNKNASK
jgi:hypothetical protein